MRASHFISYRRGCNLLEAWSTRFGGVVIGMAVVSFWFIGSFQLSCIPFLFSVDLPMSFVVWCGH